MRIVLAFLLCLLLQAGQVYGHGVHYSLAEAQAVSVVFGYAGGEPMSYAEVLVFGPDSPPDLEFQNGRTDSRGMFAFIPDKPGTWRIAASDGTGHRAEFSIPVAESLLPNEGDAPSPSSRIGPSGTTILLGLSLLANLALIGIARRRR